MFKKVTMIFLVLLFSLKVSAQEQIDSSSTQYQQADQQTARQQTTAEEEDYWLSLQEQTDKWYLMAGALLKCIFIPSYILDWFGDYPSGEDGPFMVNPAAGASFTVRKNSFDIIASIWWAGYMSREFLYAETGEAQTDPEFIDNSLSLFLFTVDFMMSYDITPWFALEYGGGLGLGIVLGEVRRTEAMASGGGWVPCTSPGSSGYCESTSGDDDTRGYYNDLEDRVPPVIPWVNILLGARFKVHKNVSINIDGGLGVGWVLGLRVNYII